jgi:predicted site-specific integrase-resolvase
LLVSIAPESVDELLTTARAANLVGVSVETIRQWRHRGHIEVKGLTEHGRPMYRWLDVVLAERATRDKARRTFAA